MRCGVGSRWAARTSSTSSARSRRWGSSCSSSRAASTACSASSRTTRSGSPPDSRRWSSRRSSSSAPPCSTSIRTLGYARARRVTEERSEMPTYLMLTTLTEKGVQTLHANPGRLREVNRDVEEMGAKVLHQWAALGEYDFVNIIEAPDDLTVAKVSLALGARGSAKLESLPLIQVDDLLAKFE